MLRRSLSVLLFLTILVLAMIVGYAFLNRTGTEDALTRAEELRNRGKPAQAIRLLNDAQRALGPSGKKALKIRLLQLRYRAHWAVRNYDRAIRDVRALEDNLGVRKDALDDDLISLYLSAKKPREALALAEKRLTKAPRPKLFDAAGRAVQAIYQGKLETLLHETLPTALGDKKAREAVVLLLRFLYREPGNAFGEEARKAFRRLLEEEKEDELSVQEITGTIEGIRRGIRQSARFYRSALHGKTPVDAALQGYTSRLLRGGRLDEAALLARLYLERSFGKAEDRYGRVIAATRAMRAFSDLEAPKLVLDTAELWLGPGGIREHVRRHAQHPSFSRSLAAIGQMARAAWQLGDAKRIERMLAELQEVATERGLDFEPWTSYLRGLLSALRKDWNGVEQGLARFENELGLGPKPPEGPDLFEECMQLRVQGGLATKNPEHLKNLYNSWVALRPNDPAPLLARAEAWLDLRKPLLAARDASAILSMPEGRAVRDEALTLVLRAKDMQFEPKGRDSLKVFQDLIASGQVSPDQIAHPVLYLGVAGHALAASRPDIALHCARLTLEHYSWSRNARFLLGSAALALGTPQQAVIQAENILEGDPGHIGAIELRIRALEAAKAQEAQLRSARLDLMRHDPGSLGAAKGMAERLLDRKRFRSALRIATESQAAQRSKDGAEFAWIRGRALAGLERYVDATKELLRVPDSASTQPAAFLLGLRCSARAKDDLSEKRFLDRLLAAQPSGKELLSAAKTLVSLRRFESARRALLAIQNGEERTMDGRGAESFLLLGTVQLALGQSSTGEASLERAYSFKGGDRALPLLCLSRLLAGEKEEARDYWNQAVRPEGNAALLAYIRAKLGEPAQAIAMLDDLRFPSPRMKLLFSAALTHYCERRLPDRYKTQIPFLDKFAKDHAEAILDALALATSPAFEGRAKGAIERLRPEVESSKDRMELLSFFLLQGMQEELRDQKQRAIASYLFTINEDWAFLPGYTEMIRLARKESPEFLTSFELAARYTLVLANGFFDLAPDVRLTFLQSMARGFALLGNRKTAKNLMDLAEIYAPRDVPLLEQRFATALREKDFDKALAYADKLLRLEKGQELASVQRRAFSAAAAALDGKDARVRETPIGSKVSYWVSLAETFIFSRPPEGELAAAAASLLVMKAIASIPGYTRGDKKTEIRAIAERYLAPISDGKILPELGEDVGAIFSLWYDVDPKGPCLDRLEKLLTKDPSYLELWVLHAACLRKEGRFEEAVEKLSWLLPLVPAHEIVTELGILRGEHAIGTRREREALLKRIDGWKELTRKDRIARAMLLYRLGDVPEALAAFQSLSPETLGVTERYFQDACEILLMKSADYEKIARRMSACSKEAPDRPPFRGAEELAIQLRILAGEADRPLANGKR